MTLLSIRSTMPIDFNDPLVKLESDLENGKFDESYKKLMQSNRPKKHFIDINLLKDLCNQPLTWKQIGDILNINCETVRRYAKTWDIHKNNMPKIKAN
jgi:hypothetical protein